MLFKKTIKTCIKSCEDHICINIFVNGVPLSSMNSIKYTDHSLEICDIRPFKRKTDYGKGYGSLLMDELIKYSLQNDIHKITGNLSIVDSNHKERLHAFYRKHGFDIFEFSEPNGLFYGKIIKIL